MAGSVYSHRFILQSSGGGASYTVPAGFVAVVRNVTISNRGTTPALAKLVLVRSPNFFILSASVAAPTTTTAASPLVFDLRFVAVEGEQLAAVSDATIDLSASGYLLALP